jgi:hypothetical protein
LADDVLAVVRALEAVTSNVVKKITLDVTANLVETTPVDTGWARANWIPAISQPYRSTEGSPESVSRAAQTTGQARVATSYDIRQGSVFVSNNVPYIVRLNEGSSSQAPSGFIEAAITKAVTRDILTL